MRNAFTKALTQQARQNPNIWLLSGDIGFSVLEGFAQEFPGRFVNVGVAEQNMIGIAAGLAMSGKTVFTYTIGNFSFMRCLEQIRNDVCYHQLNVKIVAVGGGFAYGNLGYTHHAIEDIAILRVLPHLTVIAPGDPVETSLAVEMLCHEQGPGYLRLGRGGEPVIHTTPPVLIRGRAITLGQGKDIVIVTSAGTLDIAFNAAQRLRGEGHSVGLISMPILSPFDKKSLLQAAAKATRLVTVEEHGSGGLASLVAETMAEADIYVRLRSLYVRKPPISQSGDRAWLRNYHGITEEGIIEAALDA